MSTYIGAHGGSGADITFYTTQATTNDERATTREEKELRTREVGDGRVYVQDSRSKTREDNLCCFMAIAWLRCVLTCLAHLFDVKMYSRADAVVQISRTGWGRRLYLSQAQRALANYYPIATDLRASAHDERPALEK